MKEENERIKKKIIELESIYSKPKILKPIIMKKNSKIDMKKEVITEVNPEDIDDIELRKALAEYDIESTKLKEEIKYI